jgi:membrane-associated protein
VEHHVVFTYLLIFIFLIFEGEFILIVTGILVHLGALDLGPSLFFLYLGGMGKTFLGYGLGRLINKKWHQTKFLKHIEKKVHNIAPRFKRKPFWSIFISKFIIGFNHAVIIYAGYLKVDYRKYLKAEISSTVIWAPLLLFLGYFFGYTALSVSREIWEFTLVALLLIIGFILLDKLIGWIYEIFEEFYEEE